jgi:hypothetical protein
MWQYTSSASVPGVPKPCDRSWFNGTLADLNALANGGGGGGATRDVSGDGVDDLVAREAGGDNNLVDYPGNGAGSLYSRHIIAAGWGNISALAIADYTGDGHADIIGRVNDGTLNLYPGDGANGLYSPHQISTGWGAMTNIIAGDFTGDNRADLLARRNDGGLFLYHGYGNGTLSGPTTVAEPGPAWAAMLTIIGGDFNNDGHADLLAETTDYRLLLYTGHGDGALNASTEISHGWSDMTAIIPGDFNHDGRTDLLARSTVGTLRYYPMGPSTLGPGTVLTTGWNTYNLFQS